MVRVVAHPAFGFPQSFGVVGLLARRFRLGDDTAEIADQAGGGFVVDQPIAGHYAAGAGDQKTARQSPYTFTALVRSGVRFAGGEDREFATA